MAEVDHDQQQAVIHISPIVTSSDASQSEQSSLVPNQVDEVSLICTSTGRDDAVEVKTGSPSYGSADPGGSGGGTFLTTGPRSDDRIGTDDPASPAPASVSPSSSSCKAALERFFRVEISWPAFVGACKRRITALGIVTGCCSGFLGGMFSVSGPPMMIYFSNSKLDKAQIRASSSNLGLLMIIPSIISATVFGVFNADSILLYIFPPFAVLAGCWIGDKLHYQVNTDFVTLFLMVTLILSSFSMSGAGDGSTFGTVSLFFLSICCVILVLALAATQFELKKIAQKRHRLKIDTPKTRSESASDSL